MSREDTHSNLIMYKTSVCFIHLCLFCCVTAESKPDSTIDAPKEVVTESWCDHMIFNRIIDKPYQTWILSILASCVIGLSGVVPLIFIPIDSGAKLNEQGGSNFLRLLLSFAVGGLLGDVFLHLLPEAWNHIESLGPELHSSHLTLGLWVLLGMFSFVILEIMFAASENKKDHKISSEVHTKNGLYSEKILESTELSNLVCNGNTSTHCETCSGFQEKNMQNGHEVKPLLNGTGKFTKEPPKALQTIHVSGYLNLMANSIDNFTHGLAVAASFLVGNKMGILTTFAILIHEIPHEIGDFAILLRSGFNPWNAAKAQMSTATIGILGAIVALSSESTDKVGACTSWILPFTSGGFLNIALVNVLPDLLKEKDPWESVKQMICICGGIGVMALVSLLVQ